MSKTQYLNNGNKIASLTKKEKQREAARRYYYKHHEKVKARKRAWNYEHKEKIAVIRERWKHDNPEKLKSMVLKSFHKYRDSMRKGILQMLGNKCKNCGNSNKIVLQIDHVNGGGGKERLIYGGNSTNYYKHILKELKSGSKEYQLLCANCNIIKAQENNEQNIRLEMKK